MRVRQIRNATALLTIASHNILIDPMLCDAGSMPGFKMFGGGRRPNPLVELPEQTEALLSQVTDVLITHEHPDHLDEKAYAWIKERNLPVWASAIDVASLRRKGLDAKNMQSGVFGMQVEQIEAKHGRGLLGWLMSPSSGFYLAHPEEPSVYITGDSILTETILEAIDRLKPDLLIVPAGSANMGIGGNILFSVDELVTLVQHAPKDVLFNHLESLDHCPTTRAGLRERMQREGLSERVWIPEDGEEISFTMEKTTPHIAPQTKAQTRPGFQKWFTSRFMAV
ncbi:MAG: hypothetical protein CL920_18975 [Deltaproteobacteria bacterium]|nr:hypothetical protein [Deltaproteobacteria bacterium]|tara:strand:+ start:43573 stop:44418 length:846 start_codon:yes stop_codon:yes gene_type:complete